MPPWFLPFMAGLVTPLILRTTAGLMLFGARKVVTPAWAHVFWSNGAGGMPAGWYYMTALNLRPIALPNAPTTGTVTIREVEDAVLRLHPKMTRESINVYVAEPDWI